MFRFLNKLFNRCEVDEHDRELFSSIKEEILTQGFTRVDWKTLEQKYRVQYYEQYSQEKIRRVFDQAFKSAFVDYSM